MLTCDLYRGSNCSFSLEFLAHGWAVDLLSATFPDSFWVPLEQTNLALFYFFNNQDHVSRTLVLAHFITVCRHRTLLDGFPILNNGPADRLELFTWQLWFSISYWISLMPNGFRFFVFVFANVRIPALESSRQTSCFSNWIKLRLLYSENKAQRETMQLSPDNWSQFVRHSLQYWCARHLVSTNVLPWHNWCPIAKSNFSSDGG